LKALADVTFESLNNFKSLLSSAQGFLKAT